MLNLPTVLLAATTAAFLVLERCFPGRTLPAADRWYLRAGLINFAQLLITLATAGVWQHLFGELSLLSFAEWESPALEGFVGWFVGTFFFYWWHRLRHANGWWLVFHQIHHSPARIEVLTSFYKHPIEILSDAFIAALVLYPLLGCSLEGALWFNLFAATGEYVYHANLRTPRWLRYFIQTPELHSVHHELDVHKYNYGDLPLLGSPFRHLPGRDRVRRAARFPRRVLGDTHSRKLNVRLSEALGCNYAGLARRAYDGRA
jgi:sterol desaturase/sphingolipid hydroxylase (fatty acid hydroxylase superfamily)